MASLEFYLRWNSVVLVFAIEHGVPEWKLADRVFVVVGLLAGRGHAGLISLDVKLVCSLVMTPSMLAGDDTLAARW